jgi:hypothetical protein
VHKNEEEKPFSTKTMELFSFHAIQPLIEVQLVVEQNPNAYPIVLEEIDPSSNGSWRIN